MLLTSAATYASFGPLIRYLSDYFGNYTQITGRLLVSFALALILRPSGANLSHRKKLSKSLWITLFIIAFPLSIITFTIAVRTTSIAVAVFSLYAGSLTTTTLIGQFALKDKLTFRRLFSIALTAFGVLAATIFTTASASYTIAGLFLALISGICDGLANASRRALEQSEMQRLLPRQFAFGAALSLVLALTFDANKFTNPTLGAWLIMAVYGALVFGLGRVLIVCFRYVPARVGTQILSTEILFAALYGYVFLKEDLSFEQVIGGLLIMLGALIASYEDPPSDIVDYTHTSCDQRASPVP